MHKDKITYVCIIYNCYPYVCSCVYSHCIQADLRQEVSLDYTALFSQGLFLDKAENSELSAEFIVGRKAFQPFKEIQSVIVSNTSEVYSRNVTQSL